MSLARNMPVTEPYHRNRHGTRGGRVRDRAETGPRRAAADPHRREKITLEIIAVSFFALAACMIVLRQQLT